MTFSGWPRKQPGYKLPYSIGKDINVIAERSNNSNVQSVNLFWRHDKPWINRKVRKVNLRLDLVHLGCSNSHIQVTSNRRLHDPWSVSTFMRQKKLTLPTTKSLGDKNASGTDSIPDITSATASPL